MVKKFVSLVALSISSLGYASIGLTANIGTLSALHDTSNLNGSQTPFSANGYKPAADGDLYINSFNLVPGTVYDAGLNFELSTVFNVYDGAATTTHMLGDMITGEAWFNFNGLAARYDSVDAAIPNGFYDFSVEVLGGTAATSTDVIDSVHFVVEVADRIDFHTNALVTPNPMTMGGNGIVSATLTNDMVGRNLKTTTWWISGFNDGAGHTLDFINFRGDWFSTDLAPGASATGDHSEWRAGTAAVNGNYTSNTGIVGGLYQGDWHWMSANARVAVVPEPATLAVLGFGAVALMRRRRT